MKFAAQIAAAIEVLTAMEVNRKPVAECVKEWGAAHRFAGSKDRATIASLVYDVLRNRSSSAWVMKSETPRALVLGMLVVVRGYSAEQLNGLFAESPHAPEAVTAEEMAELTGNSLDNAPAWVQGNYPEWMEPHMVQAFGDNRVVEAQALSARAPLDVRVNTLKGDRAKALRQLEYLKAEASPLSPWGIRVPLLDDGRGPPVQSEPAFMRGLVEVQDEGSQLVALLANPAPGSQVVDICAGAGGKTLALSAAMGNSGQIYAYDSDIRRLKAIWDRLDRAGVRNVQVRSPKTFGNTGEVPELQDLNGRADLVVVDAPCSGTGTWRRNPDAKWRLRSGALNERNKAQDRVLDAAAVLLKSGGRLVYITCSFLPQENEERVGAFLDRNKGFQVVAPSVVAVNAGQPALALKAATAGGQGLLFTPYRTGTDAFYICVLERV